LAFTTIRGTSGAADTFAGSNGVDSISFVNQANAFLLYGAESNDTVTVTLGLNGAVTAGSLKGGAGNDTYNLTGAVFASGSLQGNQGSDTLTVVGTSNSTVQGGQGTDTININGNAAGSYFNGNKERDIITLGAFALTSSSILGGQGDDSITSTGTFTSSAIYGDLGDDVITSTTTANYSSSTIFGGNGADTLTENGNFNAFLSGDDGNDIITTAGGTDTVLGGEGNDTIATAGGTDSILGGGGNDSMTAGAGSDTLTGAGGVDTFRQFDGASAVVSAVGLSANIATGDTFTIAANGSGAADVITDFTAADILSLTSVAGGVVNLNGFAIANAGGVAANTAFTVTGNYNASTGVFTVNTTAAGLDTLVIRNAAAIGAGTGLAIGNIGAAANSSVTVFQNYNAGLTAGTTIQTAV